MKPLPFRFGVVDTPGAKRGGQARRLEEIGFDVLLMPDRPQLPSPLPALAAAAAVTESLRLGTYVLAASLHEPRAVARDCRTVQEVSGGRFEPGLGAGLEPGTPTERRQRMAALVEAVRRELPEARLLVAASGKAGLEIAARLGDMVAISLPPTASEADVARRIGWLREAAGSRADRIELNLNLAAVGDAPAPYLGARGVRAEDLREAGSPTVLWGDADHMCEQLEQRRERLGVSYWSVSAAFASVFRPVLTRLGGRES
jgi:alkanesulfonate monooxygenase SsuD/methylene tetrahydromethanopterin reductase-like flavin-dependent oxidoreductase (luciferase family)